MSNVSFSLYEKQNYALERISQGVNVFITGPGGVGKSVLVNKIRELYDSSTIFLSPTGVAALNIKGSTIHRQFKFPLGLLDDARCKHVHQSVEDLFRDKETIKRIVIDEISMVRADLFTAIDQNLQRARRSRKPFGGIQIIVVGDFFQLPPVLQDGTSEADMFYKMYSSPFCFTTKSWETGGFELIELDRVMRTDDKDFIMLLQSIRKKDKMHSEAVELFNTICYDKYDHPDEDAIVLCTTNAEADRINQVNFDDLRTPIHYFTADVSPGLKLEPAPKDLYLKEGARIMMIANDLTDKFVNGQLGYCVGFVGEDNTKIMVLLDGDKTPIPVEQYKWEEKEYAVDTNGKLVHNVVGTFKQYPIRLAYAITIHKSQGVSLSSAHINMGRGAFAHGQAYVALSRLRSMHRLNLMKPLSVRDILVDEEVVSFYNTVAQSNLMSYITSQS